MLSQRTLKKEIYAIGIGLHSGSKVKIVLKPAPVDYGIKFVKVTAAGRTLIEACAANVIDTSYATTLGKDGEAIGTVEHLLAAFYGLGVDNALVEVHGDEVPIMDGSAIPFVFLIKSAGIARQPASKRFLVVREEMTVRDGDKFVTLAPGRTLTLSCSIEFKHPLIKRQVYDFTFSDIEFEHQISRARTFGFLREVEMLKANGLARGGSLENAIVLDNFGIVNDGGLRFADEFVRHKILDCLGDISLLGMPLIARVTSHKSGHALNHQLVQAVLARPAAWEIVVPEATRPAAAALDFDVPPLTVAVP
ncbi:MAG: UDP-3-O-acyl-N-acetylglucosamine deacetylase [Deltaproteobacteria bacterium]|nr:UDP-3-O-acyl-N-acetylglucosamine deacetylase [Deltaproteobacteria bacterium]